MRRAADRGRGGDASGMSDPQVCISGGAGLGGTGMLDDKKIEEKTDV